ncbi:MAG: carbohydrate kinase family protein [Candidatus Hydrogenedentes bacterium]|nr:carbohydrate kinase family protein [Candidatus Hydrogenedentota bacterium]
MAVELVTVGVVCADVMVRPVDSFPAWGALGVVPHLELHLGGLAAVTASVYSQLGGSAAFVGSIGTDSFGDFLVNALQQRGVDMSAVRRDPANSSSATVVLISSNGERTFLHHIGTNGQVVVDDIDFEMVSHAKVFHWGGPALTPRLAGEPMARLFERARAAGVKTSMDTSFDGHGHWLPLIEPSLSQLDIIFSSLEEARHYTGKETPEDIADFYRSYGVETAVIKLGEHGLYLKSRDVAEHLPAHKVQVVDTTGAGDAACGGFLYGYAHGWDPLRCGRLANAVGGLTVQAMGGAEAITSLEATLAFMEQSQECYG